MESFLFAQQGHVAPFWLRFPITADHSWSGPLSQYHHTFRGDLDRTSDEVSLPFLFGCHSVANWGNRVCRELVTDTLLLEQNGQPLPA